MIALLIANGDVPSQRLVKRLASSADIIVCADGGANAACRMNIAPDIILGDIDSVSRATRKFFKQIPLMVIESQESTDLEKAILFCIRKKCTSVSIVGAVGSRIDHTTGSLGCFKRFKDRIEIKLYDREGIAMLIRDSVRIKATRGETISLIPLERCTGVTTRNLYYPLRDAVLELGVREGISNVAIGRYVSISYKKGTLLLYRFHSKS